MPGRSVAPSVSSAKPTPPAAPAPGVSTCARRELVGPRVEPALQFATCSADAPFCGAYTAAAPCGPSRGLSRPRRRRARPPTGRRRRAPRPDRARRRCSRCRRRRRRPGRAPSATRLRITSPRPRLLAVIGANAPPGSRASPHTAGQLDHRGVAAPGVARVDRFAGRAARRHRHPFEAGGHRGVHRPVPAVGHRHADDVERRASSARSPAATRPGDLGSGQRALELVGGDEHAHHDSPTRRAVEPEQGRPGPRRPARAPRPRRARRSAGRARARRPSPARWPARPAPRRRPSCR